MGDRSSSSGSDSFALHAARKGPQRAWFRRAARGGLLVATSALLWVGAAQALVYDDFSDGNDLGWTHYNSSASFDVTDGRYVISLPLVGSEEIAASEVGGIAASFSDVVVAAEITGWTGGDERYYGIGAGDTDPLSGDFFEGYAIAYVNESAAESQPRLPGKSQEDPRYGTADPPA